MRILLTSVPFAPSVGGIETVSALLAAEFAALGHEVAVATLTPGGAAPPAAGGYRLLRTPSAAVLLRAAARADVVLQNNVSLRLGWPAAVLPSKPCVVAHHVWTPRHGGGGVAGRLKHAALRRAVNVAVSTALARSLDVPCGLVPNPYDATTFRVLPDVTRERELVFLGRLVSDKGAAVLLDALGLLRAEGLAPTLTLIGGGPEERALRAQSARLGLDGQVEFAGVLRGEALVRRLNAHRVLVVPSVWDEPFGLVALEGLACGLLPVVARSGGLPDAAGPDAVVVPKGDARALAAALATALADDDARRRRVADGAAHLARHAPTAAARAWLDVLQAACERRAPAVAARPEAP